jgi:hypothetical protein
MLYRSGPQRNLRHKYQHGRKYVYIIERMAICGSTPYGSRVGRVSSNLAVGLHCAGRAAAATAP